MEPGSLLRFQLLGSAGLWIISVHLLFIILIWNKLLNDVDPLQKGSS